MAEGMHDQPPPQIVQLRMMISHLMLDPVALSEPYRLITELDMCVNLIDAIIQKHPMLTGDYFLRYGRDTEP